MTIHLLLPSTILLLFFLTTLRVPSSCLAHEDLYTACGRPYVCGNISNISYPFWGHDRLCGSNDGLKLECKDNKSLIYIGKKEPFYVKSIDQNKHTITLIAQEDACNRKFPNITLDQSLFQYASTVTENITIFYHCSPSDVPNDIPIPPRNFFECNNSVPVTYVNQSLVENHYQILEKCENYNIVPVTLNPFEDTEGGRNALQKALERGFDVGYKAEYALMCSNCEHSKGRCGRNASTASGFSCHCREGSYPGTCPHRHGIDWGRKIIVAVSAASASAIIVCTLFVVYLRHYKKWHFVSSRNFKSMSSHMSSLKDPEKGSKHFGLHVFTYSELEEATDNFNSSRELGDGGFGTVYYGKLQDGRCVAVKRLYENNCRRVEQFMNEVAILTHLRHPNLVSLYGSTSRHSRELLLVYEYIPNGTVADHLHGERAKPSALTWPIRLNIAIETASALAYLHASDIIHRDVKTTNILLDENFCVKVVDFGLSRLFPNDVTHISTAPQGTPGYVDPEYHECYQLTDKSDVYSFGVVLIELISSKPAVDITRHRHEINLANMAINKIQNQALHELVDPCLGFESDCKVRKMINAVAELAFQCLQNLKDLRPQMKEVLESLKDIKGDGHNKGEAEVMDISEDDTMLLRNTLPSPSQSPM